ncbi:Gamma-glutamyltranspeptidase @ Glutathione hydrolase [hydrothermal vent metagenome]|uniref:Gamma-glutamyltranspeptidase @ Glutathione hydrolase n=1 Tax=hydrothermal vent metagenome TaxID=652676 RepID=A0A3B0YM57_9ZZZZ
MLSRFVMVLIMSLVFVNSHAQNLKANTNSIPATHAVASAHPLATKAGIDILKAGGNAFDAAVAVSAVLAVVEPYSSGLGGGGFWLIYRKRDGFTTMIDGREKAPAAASRNMYLDKNQKVITGKSVDTVLGAGIPGEPAALVHLSKKYGRLRLSQVLAPAIKVARQGFKVDKVYFRLASFRHRVLLKSQSAAKIFLIKGQVPAIGSIIKQPDLARTLRAIARKGNKGFYQGSIARKMVRSVRKAGGIWTLQDLKNYRVIERKPIVGYYKHYKITSAAPPSSGGVALIQMLNILQYYKLDKLSAWRKIHVIVEAMRRAYRDRAEYLGDSDYVKVPVLQLTSQQHAKKLKSSIRRWRATPSSKLKQVNALPKESHHTTHFSVIDAEGNRVAATLSINYPFGSGFVAKGTGILLNDEMDDFSSKPGTPNVYGLVGAEANAVRGGKRPLSSMSPTFVESNDKVMIVGTPGGSRIITMVLQAILGHAQGLSAKQIVAGKRFHHQYLPDQIQFEPGILTTKLLKKLTGYKHTIKPLKADYGNMQIIIWDKKLNTVTAASDPRGVGSAVVNKPGK